MDAAWVTLTVLVERALAVWASIHIILRKRDVRAAIGWTGLVWLVPVIGPAAYGLFGINRIKRRAARLRSNEAHPPPGRFEDDGTAEQLSARHPSLIPIARLVDQVTRSPLVPGNQVEPLVGGDEAYPDMLDSIDRASSSVALATYIFDNDRAGGRFVEALARAHERGVHVRVLIDGAGKRYSVPPITRTLRKRGIPTSVFLESTMPWRNPYLNLRNHRKLLVVDGRTGYTGGLNIREGCVLSLRPKHPVQDIHFRFQGPVVRQLLDTFVLDWAFTDGEVLRGERWQASIQATGATHARGVPDGPDEDFEAISQVLLGALSQAQRRVRICTPYFLPDATLIAALNTAAMRGVAVEIFVPAKCNLRFVQWAATAQADQMLQAGCRMYLTPPPFDHTKLMLVDEAWVFVGSANWDPRSLRLNFEFNVECYDERLSERLHEIIDGKLHAAAELTLAQLRQRPLPIQLRDGIMRLFSPYL